MLSETEMQVLLAVAEQCRSEGAVSLRPNRPLPDRLADLHLPDAENRRVIANLVGLGIVRGVATASGRIVVSGLTARGREELAGWRFRPTEPS